MQSLGEQIRSNGYPFALADRDDLRRVWTLACNANAELAEQWERDQGTAKVWLDEIAGELHGWPHDERHAYPPNMLPGMIHALQIQLAEAKRRFEQLAFLYRAERAGGWGDDTDSPRRLAYDAETEAALRQE